MNVVSYFKGCITFTIPDVPTFVFLKKLFTKNKTKYYELYKTCKAI